MPIQTIGLPQQYGKGLGEGLESLLANLAGSKIQQLHQRQQAKQFQSVLSGLSPDKAQALAALPPELQQLAFKDLLAQPGQQAYAQALAGLGGQQAPQQQQQALQPNISPMESLQLLQGQVPQQMFQQQPQGQFEPQQQEQVLPRLNEKQATEIAKLRREDIKEQRKISREDQKEATKETLPLFNDVTRGAKAAKDSNLRLDRMEKLVDKGKLNSNFLLRSLDALTNIPYVGHAAGAIEAALINRDSQEFKKLSADFVKDAKNFFGSRITQKEVELFLNTVPTLMQTDPGKRAIINNMRSFNQAALLRKEAADEIIEENGGKRPYNLDSLIEKRISKQLDALAEKFAAGLPNEVGNEGYSLWDLLPTLRE